MELYHFEFALYQSLTELVFNDMSTLVVEEIVAMKERDRRERKMNESENRKNKNIPPLPLPATRIAGLAQL